ncbi:MAG: hypothetical protein EPN85_08970, partial [Bacteroidetes bacterium]
MKNKTTSAQMQIPLILFFFLSSLFNFLPGKMGKDSDGALFAQGPGTWGQKADIPGPVGRSYAVGFSIGTKGYVGTGMRLSSFGSTYLKDFWEWDQGTNVWTQKADFGGGIRYNAVGFSVGAKGYIGTGSTNSVTPYNDFWEWSQAGNTWIKKADLPVSGGRTGAIGFSIGNKGYIGTGKNGSNSTQNDFLEWNQTTDTWTQKANFGGLARHEAVGFSIGTKGYVGTGAQTSTGQYTPPTGPLNDFWEWNQITDAWTQKANFGGAARWAAVGFSIGSKGYIGTGYDGANTAKDFWEWDQATNTWTVKASYPGGVSTPGWVNEGQAVGFSIGCYGYIGTGTGDKYGFKDFWEYTPDPLPANCCVLVAGISGPDTVCIGSNAFISASGGTNYSWSTGATTATITVNQSVSTTYTVIVSDANGCSDVVTVIVPVKNCCTATAVVSSDPSSTVCVGQQVFISASGGTTYSWNTGVTTANIVAAPSVTTTYSVAITDAAGCTGIGTLTVPVDLGCTATGIDQLNAEALQVEVWPNPSIGEFRIGDLGLGIYNLDLYNVFGEKVYADKIL